jgi:DNA-binding response OmpR family regulator
VIVADSYEAARRPCIRYLDHFSFDVAPAPDGQSAIDAIGSQTTAVILMDSHLKDPLSRRQLGAESLAQGIPMILMVDTQSEARDPEMSELEPAAVLVKPFPLAVMIDTIRGVLRARSTTTIN